MLNPAHHQVGAHAKPCPQPKSPTLSLWASELDKGAIEESGLYSGINIFFYIIMWMVRCVLLTFWKDDTNMGRKQLKKFFFKNLLRW